MIDWSKVSTPGAPPSASPQTTTPAIPAPTGVEQEGPGLGSSFGNSTQSSAGYETGKGWRPLSQEEFDALDPGQRIANGIDQLGYMLFGNQSDMQGGEQFGHVAPLSHPVFQPVRNAIGLAGEAVHAVGTITTVRPIEIGATVLSSMPMGWATGSDRTFEEIGKRLAANPTPMNTELYATWQKTKAMADSDILGGGNLKADFNDEVLRMYDDMQYNSTLGTTPTLALGGKTVGSFGGALSHAIESFLGVASNQSQLLLGQAGVFDPGGDRATYEQQRRIWDLEKSGASAVDIFAATDAAGGHGPGDEQRVIFQMLDDGKITEAEARSKIAEISAGGRSRIDEIGARADMGLEVSDVEQRAWDAYKTGAWSKQHAEEWLVSHGQGITRNPVGQIGVSVLTDPLTLGTLALGGISAVGTSGLKAAEAANVTIQTMKGLSITERIAASTGNAARIAAEIPNAANAFDKVALGVAAVQKSPAGPVARIARGLVDPFAVYKPNMVQKTAMQLQGEVAVGGLQRAAGPVNFAEARALARESDMATEVDQALANYAFDQSNLMVATEYRNQGLARGLGIEMMDPTSELNNVDEVIAPMAANYATRDAETRVADHILEHSKVTFTADEEANLVHRLGTTMGGKVNWTERVGKMNHDLKALLHAITYKLTETDFYKAMNAVDRTAYDGDLPLHLGTIMDANTMDEEMARKTVTDIEDILASKEPNRIELATAEWNNRAAKYKHMENLGYAPGGEQQLKALIREMKSEIEHGGFPKVWTEQELSHPALQPIRDHLDRHSIPMAPEEIAAAKEQARKTATTAFKRKAAVEARRQTLKDALRALETKAGKVKAGKQAEHDAAQKALEDFLAKHPEAKARFDVKAEREAVEAAKLEDEAYLKGFEAARRSKTGDVVKAKERFAAANPLNPDTNSLFEAGWADAQAGKNFGDALAAGGYGVDNLPPPGSMAPTLEETVKAAEDSVTGTRRLWKIGSRPDETVAWGLRYDPNNGLPIIMREPTVSHSFMAYPGKAPFSDTVRNRLGQIIGTVPAERVARPVDSLEAFIKTTQDVITGRRLVMNMEHRFTRSMTAAGVPAPLIKSIFAKAKDVAGMEQTTIRGLKATESGGLWKAIADDIPRDLRLADGTALDIHTVMDHLLVAAEGDVRVMGLTSKFSQRMRNAMRQANLDPVNYSGQLSVTAYNKMRYALNPTFLIQRMTDSIYYSILYGVTPIGRGALSESNMALKAITENLARTGMARDFAFDLPEYATRANWTAGVKSAMQQAGISESTLSKIANTPDALIQNNMVNLLHARLGNIVRGTLDNLATAIEKDATLIAGATPEQAYILRQSFADWRATYSKNAGRVLNDDEVGLLYIKDMLSGWRRIGPINPDTGMIDMTKLIHEGAMMLPSDVGAIGSLMPDSLASELGYVGINPADVMRKDVMGTMQKVGGTFVHVPGEHDLAWLKEQLVNTLGAHPDYVKRALAYFGDTWDNFWYRLSQPLDKGGLDISEHYAKEAQQIIAKLARDRGMDPWEYLSGVMLINSGTDSLDTAVGRFVNFLKKGEVAAEPSDWGAFFRSHLDPSAQATLMDAYAKAKFAASEAMKAPKAGDKFVRTEADGRQFQWHVTHYDPKTGKISITTNPKGVGRLGVMSRAEWDAMKGTPAATAAATPADVPIQPPLGFITNPHVIASGHDIPIDVPRDGLYHVTTGKDGVMSEGFRGSNAGEAATTIPNAPFTPGATPRETWDSVLQGMGLPGRKADGTLARPEFPKIQTRVGPGGKWEFPNGYPQDAPHAPALDYSYFNADELTLTAPDGTPMEVATFQNEYGNTFGVPGTERPIQYVYRAISEEDYQGILKSGVMKSDGRMNLSMDEGTVASHRDPSWYLPGDLASDQPGEYAGRVVKIKVKEGDGWHIDGRDSYIKTSQPIPVDRIEMVSPKIVKTRTHTPSKYNTAERTYSDEVSVEVTAITPDAKQRQGIGSFGDTHNKGRVSIVTSAARAQAYHDRLLLAVKAARGETDVAEIGDYFEPLYRKAYGDKWGERMATAVADEKLLAGTTHTPQELVWIVKRLDDGLVGGAGGRSGGGILTDLTAVEGAVHLTSKAEQLAQIDPEQIAILNLAVSEKAVAKKGIDVGELTLLPEDVRPMSVAGESKAKGTSFVDPMEDDAYKQQFDAWQQEQDEIGADQVRFNQEQEQHTYAQLAHENDMINYRRDMKQYERLEKQHVVLQKEYDDVAAENARRDAQYAAEEAQWKKDYKVYEEEKKAWDEAVEAADDELNSDAVPEPVQSVITKWTGDARKKSKATTRLRADLEKLKDEGYDVDQADSLLDDYMDMERDPDTTMEDYGYEKDDAWQSIMDELESVAPIEKELPDEPIPPIKPDHPGELPLPPKPIAPVEPEEPIAPTPPKPVREAKLTKPVPPEPKPMALEQAPEPEIPPVDETEFWDKGIIDMLEQRSKTGPHPNPDVEGAIQKVAELTQRVLKDSKGSKNTRNTIRELGKAIPLTNPVPYNRTHALIQHLIQTKIEDSQRDIFRLVEMQTQRTVLERSLNHPLFGLYPSSYMWGKVLPESIKFLAKNPFAATYIINDVQRAIALRREFDPEFEDRMNSVDRSAAAFWVDYMTPGLPWSDHSARVSPMVRDLMKGDLLNIIPDELATMDPKRWYDQTLRSLKEIPGAVDTIMGEPDVQKQLGGLGSSFGGGGPVAAPGNATPEEISGAVKAAALAPILADDMSRLQDILLGGKDAAED